MQIPLQVTFRGFPHSEAMENRIREKVQKLERYYDKITSCRVMVERTHHKHHKGDLYHVRIDLTVPGKEIVISREHHDNHAYEDAYVAIRDAFQAAARQLEEYARIQRGEVKGRGKAALG